MNEFYLFLFQFIYFHKITGTTFGYVAPELKGSIQKFDKTCDIYAMGISMLWAFQCMKLFKRNPGYVTAKGYKLIDTSILSSIFTESTCCSRCKTKGLFLEEW